MKDEATPEQIAMARRIVADLYPSSPGERALVLDGSWDRAPNIRAAIAAIIETTELAYRLAADHVDQCDDTAVGRARNATARDIYEALRSGDHLKGPNNG